jgi:hypothetical protein
MTKHTRDVKAIGHAAGGLVAQTLVQLADGDYAASYIGLGRKAPEAKLELVMFEGGLDAAKAWITTKDKVDAVVVGLDEDEQEVRLLLGCPDATRKYDMICSVRYAVNGTGVKPKPKAKAKPGPAVQTSTIGFLAETPDEDVADDFLDGVLAGIYSHARAAELDVGKLGDYDDLE